MKGRDYCTKIVPAISFKTTYQNIEMSYLKKILKAKISTRICLAFSWNNFGLIL